MSHPAVEEVTVAARQFRAYESFNTAAYGRVLDEAARIQGKRILHLNSTEKGGGVAELLHSQVALERDVGLQSRWLVLRPQAREFFAVTKRLHNLLQGGTGDVSAAEWQVYERESERFVAALTDEVADADVLVVHDPQPLAVAAVLPGYTPKIFRLHVDLASPPATIAGWLCDRLSSFARIVVSRPDCTLPCFLAERVSVIAPAIDPLASKNQPMLFDAARQILKRHGIEVDRPLITQVSRFDIWKDQLGVLEAYWQAKEEVPDLQLALVGFFQADDDPEAEDYFNQVRESAAHDPDVFLFFSLSQLQGVTNEVFVSAMQAGSDIVLQKSVREGFGLTVTEAMWKRAAVIGGRVGGIALQIQDGITGRLVETPAEAASAIVSLVGAPAQRQRFGQAAHESVAEHYLISRYLAENLAAYRHVLAEQKG